MLVAPVAARNDLFMTTSPAHVAEIEHVIAIEDEIGRPTRCVAQQRRRHRRPLGEQAHLLE
jgi:hypothetical protein